MKYKVVKDGSYDFSGESYGKDFCPNLHRYPATMIPQVGIRALEELNIKKGAMLDPYCGSGSSFASGLHCGINDFTGFDLNPLALLITRARFTKINMKELEKLSQVTEEVIYAEISGKKKRTIEQQSFSNFDYWFNPEVASHLQLIKDVISDMESPAIRDFFLVALSSTMRDCSYTRNNEFKLYRMKEDAVSIFNPDVVRTFFSNLRDIIEIYNKHYDSLLKKVKLELHENAFQKNGKNYDVVLTSPPYGDSRTTVAYGQFSIFANSWVCGVGNARSLDRMLMGGMRKENEQLSGLMSKYVDKVSSVDKKRAEEVGAFYIDLAQSITDVSGAVKKHGYSIYVVGNRTVKGVTLPTDQFIAEQFEKNGFKHLVTHERVISNKRMPKLNSPTNKPGKKMQTMNNEYIIVCQKH